MEGNRHNGLNRGDRTGVQILAQKRRQRLDQMESVPILQAMHHVAQRPLEVVGRSDAVDPTRPQPTRCAYCDACRGRPASLADGRLNSRQTGGARRAKPRPEGTAAGAAWRQHQIQQSRDPALPSGGQPIVVAAMRVGHMAIIAVRQRACQRKLRRCSAPSRSPGSAKPRRRWGPVEDYSCSSMTVTLKETVTPKKARDQRPELAGTGWRDVSSATA